MTYDQWKTDSGYAERTPEEENEGRSMTPSTLPDTAKGVTEAIIAQLVGALKISRRSMPLNIGASPHIRAAHKVVDAALEAAAALSPLPAPEPTEGIAELVGRLNAATMDFAWADLPDDAAIPAVPLLREAAAALAALQAERDDLDRRLNEEQMQTENGGEIINELKARLAEAERQRDEWKEMHGRVVEGFMEVCEAVGVQFDAPEAVAYAINTKISNAEHDKRAAEAEIAAMKEGAATEVSIKPMQLSGGRCDYFVSFKHGDREVTPHVFRERFKAEYHVALYRWLFEGGEEPKIVDFNHGEWPARTYTNDERQAFAALTHPAPADKGVVECASEDCEQPATRYYAKFGVGSHHCEVCYQRIVALAAASPPAEGDGR